MTRIIFISINIAALLAGLFTYNGLTPTWMNPDFGRTSHPELEIDGDTLRVLSYNLAKVDFYDGGLSFRSPDSVRAHLDRIANLISEQDPHFVFLSEVVFECGPCPVNQVQYLAEKTGMSYYVFGENYRWGLPFYRIRAGNAVLSRVKLLPQRTEQLIGKKPFYDPTNNRRILWCDTYIHGRRIKLASIHNDSYDITNNARQIEQIITTLDSVPSIIAGDFNATPAQYPIKELINNYDAVAVLDGPPTFPSYAPRKCIDLIFAPGEWKIVDHKVLSSELSDHLPVTSAFAIPDTFRTNMLN